MGERKLRDPVRSARTGGRRKRLPRAFLIPIALILVLGSVLIVIAAAPSTGTISPSGPVSPFDGTWTGTAVGGAASGEGTCVEGVNCDTFTLTVSGAPADYAGKVIAIKIQWTNPVNDYDLYVHKDSNAGPVVARGANGGAPGTEEATTIDPAATGTGVYTVHVVYFSVTPLVDEYHGTATVENKPTGRNADYLKGGISFSPNFMVRAPVAARDGEPSSRTDKYGNHYVSGIRGVPAGVDLWYFDLQPGSPTYDPYMRHPIYRGQPDSFTGSEQTSVGADGGGDVDLAVGFNTSPNPPNPPILAFSSLVLANISVGNSTDRGENFTLNPLGNVPGGAPIDDRQWLEFLGNNSVYLLYRTVAPAVTQIQRSDDGGLTYGLAHTAGAIGQVGYIDVHQATGTVYVSGSTGQVCVGTPPLPGQAPLTYDCHQAAPEGGVANIFFVVKVADDGSPNGTAYVVYSDGKNIYLRHSNNKGVSWSDRVRVSDGPETLTSLLPWMETGPTPGSVGIAWYGTSAAVNSDSADWKVFFAQSFNADTGTPTFRQAVASDHFIHGSNISTGGTLGTANRNLLDYFQISFDPTGAAVLDYTDDHNDFDGHTFVTRQIAGPSINGGTVPAPAEGAGPFPAGPPVPPGPNGEQVVDFARDVADGLLVVTPTDDPLDILSIKYTCEGTTDPVIVATMKVSAPPAGAPASNWRMNFTANAPDSKLSPTGEYTFGLSDRGDQFWVRASTDPTQASVFSFGTAVRNSDGSITYTRRGAADAGSFNADNTITVKVVASKLNPFVTHGPPIGPGSVLVGLRGQTFTSGANAKRDIARGGTQYTIGCGQPATPTPPPTLTPSPTQTPTPSTPTPTRTGTPPTATPTRTGTPPTATPSATNTPVPPTETPTRTPTPDLRPIIKVTGGGSILVKAVNFGFNADPTPSGHLNYWDKEQDIHLVSDSIDSFMQTGPNEVTFTGTGHVGAGVSQFTVKVQDNGEPGTSDTFTIVITGAGASTRSGTLSQGNIQIHR